MTNEEALDILAMFLHKQCDLERTKFAYDANTIWDAVKMAKEALEEEPVKCRDCKYCDCGVTEDGSNVFWKCLGVHYGGVNPDDYCSYGERKEP